MLENKFMAKKKTIKKTLSLNELQLKMLRIQQGVWHKKERVIIVFEGFDAAGKGGAIRKLTEKLDPRGVRVHPIGPPHPDEQEKHYLYRFWKNLPAPGTIAIFDRSWYGRVLVERVENLVEEKRWKAAYEEINQFEKMLKDDGVLIIKIFLKISKEVQLQRFQDRLNDPYKQWKITQEDVRAREKWNDYVLAVKAMLTKTQKNISWNVINGDNKAQAREEILSIVTKELGPCEKWIQSKADRLGKRKLAKKLAGL
jgi:AMP-polyphosphate phosphotransferase